MRSGRHRLLNICSGTVFKMVIPPRAEQEYDILLEEKYVNIGVTSLFCFQRTERIRSNARK